MTHKPRRRLRYADLLCDLNRRHSLAVRGQQIDCDKPFFERQLAFAENTFRLDGEILFAGRATIPLAVGKQVNPIVTAMRAILAVTKTHLGKFRDAGFFIVEILQEIRERFEFGKIVHAIPAMMLFE